MKVSAQIAGSVQVAGMCVGSQVTAWVPVGTWLWVLRWYESSPKFLDVWCDAVFLLIATTLKYCLKILKTDYHSFP